MRLIHLCFVLTVLLAVPVLAAADDFSWTPTNPTSDQSIEFTATLSNFCVSSFTWYDETDGTVVIGQGEKIIKKLPAGNRKIRVDISCWPWGVVNTLRKTISVKGLTPKHLACVSGTCKPIDGSGTNECASEGASCTTRPPSVTLSVTKRSQLVFDITSSATKGDRPIDYCLLNCDATDADPNYDSITEDSPYSARTQYTCTYLKAKTYTINYRCYDSIGEFGAANSDVVADSTPNQNPVASFSYTPSTPVTGQDVLFDGTQSSDPDGSIASYSWNFGDGSSDTGLRPSHKYTGSGTYRVTLTVKDNLEATHSASKDIAVRSNQGNQPPVPKFSYTPAQPMVQDEVTFNASESTDDGLVSAYSWNLGDGTSATGVNVTHRYSQPGDYKVNLTAKDNEGAESSTDKTVTIKPSDNQAPTASFTTIPAQPTDGEEVTFDGSSSTDPDGSISEYSWTFGDGSTRAGSGARTTYTYQSPASYTAKLVVTDNRGAKSGEFTKTVDVAKGNKPPIAKFLVVPDVGQVGANILFNAGDSSDPDGRITRYTWDFDDGSAAEGNLTAHQFQSAGQYNVKLMVFDDGGKNSSAAKIMLVKPAVNLLINQFLILPGDSVTVEFALRFPFALGNFEVKKTEYTFGDGEMKSFDSLATLTTHTYKQKGVFNATVTLTFADGSKVDSRVEVANKGGGNFDPVPIFTYLPTSPTVGTLITFDATGSYDRDGKVMNYSWDFDTSDNIYTLNVTDSPFISTKYSSGGKKNVRLLVGDDDGRQSTIDKDIQVLPVAINLHYISDSNPLSVMFFVELTQSERKVKNITLDFGDSQVATYPPDTANKGIRHDYAKPGIYTAKANATFEDNLDPVSSQIKVSIKEAISGGMKLAIDGLEKIYGASQKLTGRLSITISRLLSENAVMMGFVNGVPAALDTQSTNVTVGGKNITIELVTYGAASITLKIDGNQSTINAFNSTDAGGYAITYFGSSQPPGIIIGLKGSQKTIPADALINRSDSLKFAFRQSPFEYKITASGKTFEQQLPNQTFLYNITASCIYGPDKLVCNIPFSGIGQVNAKDGLKFIRSIDQGSLPAGRTSTTYIISMQNNQQVQAVMRQACGKESYGRFFTDKNGWIERRLAGGDLRPIANSNKMEVAGLPPFDNSSFENIARFGNSGGLYKDGVYQGTGGAEWDGPTGKLSIIDYDPNAQYLVRFFAPNGPRLCAYTEASSATSSDWKKESAVIKATAAYMSPYRKTWTEKELLSLFDVPCQTANCEKRITQVHAEKTFDTFESVQVRDSGFSSGIFTVSAQVPSPDLESPLPLTGDIAKLFNLPAPDSGSSAVLRIVALDNAGAADASAPIKICVDKDKDGFCAEDDIDDNNALRYNGAGELCNGLDDDGDGQIDEDFRIPGKAIGGACNNWPGSVCSGTWSCSDDNRTVVCRPLPGNFTPGSQAEICADNLDNDCDGTIDEVYEALNGTTQFQSGCGFASGYSKECGFSDRPPCRLGVQYWENGTYGPCIGAVYPAYEACNGIDDDCDGTVDNLESGTCEVNDDSAQIKCYDGEQKLCGPENIGTCRQGIQKCIAGSWGPCVGAVLPLGDDICADKLDNDCDGRVDEFCTPDISCKNNVHDANEDGVDCGGSCRACEPGENIKLSQGAGIAAAAVGAALIISVGVLALIGKI